MAPTSQHVLKTILSTGMIPVFYHPDPETCKSVLKACYEGGVRVFEFTNRGEKALENFALLRQLARQSMPDLLLGIGTIKAPEQVALFAEQGADFIVSPIIDPAIGAACAEKDLFWVPGCMTATEIALAERAGARLVKLFPGQLLGPGFVKAVRELFPGLLFMPTGGVEPTQESIQKWIEAGVVAVGMGSRLIGTAALQQQHIDLLAGQCRQLLKWIAATRNLSGK